MLKSGKQVRLTVKETAQLKALTGRDLSSVKSADSLNRQLDNEINAVELTDTPEGRLLAGVLSEYKTKDSPT